MTAYTIPPDTTKTCVENYKLDFFIREYLQVRHLRIDTQLLRSVIADHKVIIGQKDLQLKQDTALLKVADANVKFWGNEYDKLHIQHEKVKKRLDKAKLLNKLLGTVSITLVLVLGVIVAVQ